MKKLFLAMAILAASVTSSFAESFDNSFGVRIFGGFGSGYSTLETSEGDEYMTMDSKPQIGLSLDSRWYVAKGNVLGLAINARWLDFAYNKSYFDKVGKFDVSKLDIETNELSIEALNAGVIGTIAFNEHWAIDVYYDLGASALIKVFDYSDNLKKYDINLDDDDNDKIDNYFFGLNHKVGAALHVGFFQVGCEAKLGHLKFQKWGLSDDAKDAYDKDNAPKAKVGCARVFIGFLF